MRADLVASVIRGSPFLRGLRELQPTWDAASGGIVAQSRGIPAGRFLLSAEDVTSLTRSPGFVRLGLAASPADRAGHHVRAEVAELADAHGSGPCTRKGVGVRVPSSAPNHLESIV